MARLYFVITKLGLCNPVSCILHRHVTTDTTASALRQFYFAVHPDFFSQYPKERAVNEESLKKLNQYLDALRNSLNTSLASIRLTFFLRTASHKLPSQVHPLYIPGVFKEVQLQLSSSCLPEAVHSILSLCNLPTDGIRYDSLSAHSGHKNKVLSKSKDVSAYSNAETFHGFSRQSGPSPSSFQHLDNITLNSWLKKNIVKAAGLLKKSEVVREKTEALCDEVKIATGVRDICWASEWGVLQFRACLLSFLRLFEQHKSNLDLQGRVLVFGNENGVSLMGDIVLRHDDVPNDWLQVLQSYWEHDEYFGEVNRLERQLSLNIGSISIVRRHDVLVLVSDYVQQLRRLATSVNKYITNDLCKQQCNNKVYANLGLVVVGASEVLGLSETGHVTVPYCCPAFLMFDFLHDSAVIAFKQHEASLRFDGHESQFINDWQQQIGLKSLSRDTNISFQQMELCSNRLLKDKLACLAMNGHRLKISYFYSVMSDGEIYIPWNWES